MSHEDPFTNPDVPPVSPGDPASEPNFQSHAGTESGSGTDNPFSASRDSVADAIRKGFARAQTDGREAARSAAPKAREAAREISYHAAYGLAFGAVFTGAVVAEMLPEGLRSAFQRGARDGRDTASRAPFPTSTDPQTPPVQPA